MANELDRTEKRLEQTLTKVLDNTKRHLHATDVIMDFGCGTGLACNALAGHVQRIDAIDTSPKLLGIAKRRAVAGPIENVEYAQTTIFDEACSSRRRLAWRRR